MNFYLSCFDKLFNIELSTLPFTRYGHEVFVYVPLSASDAEMKAFEDKINVFLADLGLIGLVQSTGPGELPIYFDHNAYSISVRSEDGQIIVTKLVDD